MTDPLTRSVLAPVRRRRFHVVACVLGIAFAVAGLFAVVSHRGSRGATTAPARSAAAPPAPTLPACDEMSRIGACVDAGSAGASVVVVHPRSPAAAAGIRPGDLIEEVDCREVRNGSELRAALAAPPAGAADRARLKVVRRGVTVSYSPVTLLPIDPATQ